VSDTPRTDELEYDGIGISNFGHQDLYYAYKFARQLERELNAANSIIRQQQLLDEENLRLKERIKRLEEAGDRAIENSYYPDRVKVWHKAKEAKP
jgi:hypothetical protein